MSERPRDPRRAGLVPASIGVNRSSTYVGVGIYEEVLFRLIGFAWLAFLLRLAFVPWIAAVPMAIVVRGLVRPGPSFRADRPFVPLCS